MGKATKLLLKLAVLLFLLIHCTQSQQLFLNSRIERIALINLRSSLGLTSTNWPFKTDPCTTWRGLRCRNGRVIEINISGFKRTRIGRLNPGFNVESIANLTSLETFNASGFSLPGSIPDWFGFRVGSLRVLDLRSSSVKGVIPNSIGNLSMLTGLFLSDNQITGNIPISLGQLIQLKVLDLSSNLLTGSIPAGFGLLGNLTRLDLSLNYLSGSIPTGIGSVSRLEYLNLSDNSFAGSMPVELADLNELVVIDFGKNLLSGSLPGFVFRSQKLEVLVVRENEFSGVLPAELWSLPNLRVLDVSGNKLTGAMPSFGLNGRVNGAMYNLSNNLFYGNLSYMLDSFSWIDLSGNYIQGKFPKDSAQNLSLDRNCIKSFPNHRSLAECRLFYADRGLSLVDFESAEQIQPPLLEHASNSSKRLIYILAGLFGGTVFILLLMITMIVVLRECKKDTGSQGESTDIAPVPELMSSSLPKDSGIISNHGSFYAYERLLSSTGEFCEANLIKHGHSGDLYQGLLENGTHIVIKKINLCSMQKESYAMELEFLSKYRHARLVPFLGHCLEKENEKFLVYKYMPNRDLASSFYRVTDSEDGSLQSLDWITRLKIAIGAAESLSFLHHECIPPLVHRRAVHWSVEQLIYMAYDDLLSRVVLRLDIKGKKRGVLQKCHLIFECETYMQIAEDVQSSSILLDDKFEVRLGSLSEVCVQEGDLHMNVFARFLRRSQSFEPEYSGYSPATCSYDVYCFGKVLLELVTGKVGMSKTDNDTTREWLEHTLSCISLYDRELVARIVDPSLIIDEDLLEEVWAMAIVARSCLNPKPSRRPPMKYVLKALENPLKVVREESFSSAKLRRTFSRKSWSATVFGSRRQSTSGNAIAVGHTNQKDGIIRGFKQAGRVGSTGSGGIEYSSSIRRSSNDIFPEPLVVQDAVKLAEH